MMEIGQLHNLVRELVSLPDETEWLEFKHNNDTPADIGEYISALSNSAALLGKSRAYILWGIDDVTHHVVGTTFKPHRKQVGHEQLENWLVCQLDPRVEVIIHEEIYDGVPIVLFEIQPASYKPVSFKGVEYIRVGEYKKKLHDHTEKERMLWRVFDRVPFEKGIARENVTSDEILEIIDYPNYFRLMSQSLPDNRKAILERLISEGVLTKNPGAKYNVTNVGAMLFARNLQDFKNLSRKALRVIQYHGENKVETIREQPGTKGYAIGFEGAIKFINNQLPQNEQIGQAFRKEVRMYPEIAIRELIANALIHQDFNITGAGPMVEIFSDRLEISNPGIPLIDTLRFIAESPRSRNEILAALMRRMNICEERGSGIVKVISNVEAYQLPAPDFRVGGSSTVAILYGPRQFSEMNREERIRACYWHTCLMYVSGKRMSNMTLRKRLGIKESNYPQASRIIRDAIEEQLIKAHSEGVGSKRDATYVPFWT